MKFDDVTAIVRLGFLPTYLIWEIVTLIRRGEGFHVGTISMVAQRRGYQLPCVVYFWLSMPVHWWVDIGWASVAGTAIFWSLQLLLLVLNIVRWRHTSRPFAEWPAWERWLNWPVFWMLAGPAAAAIFFPQSAPVPWGSP